MTFFLKCKRRKNGQKFSIKIVTNEEITYTKLTSSTKTLEIENRGKYLYKTKRKWERREEKLVQNEKEEIL